MYLSKLIWCRAISIEIRCSANKIAMQSNQNCGAIKIAEQIFRSLQNSNRCSQLFENQHFKPAHSWCDIQHPEKPSNAWLILRLKRCDHHQKKFQTETWRDALTSKFHLNETFWGRHSQPAVLNQDYFSSNCILAKDLAPWGWVCPGSLDSMSDGNLLLGVVPINFKRICAIWVHIYSIFLWN